MPIEDATNLEDKASIVSDLCIIGAGPAGMAVAKEFDGSKTIVTVVESGGFGFDPETQKLAEGDVVGLPYMPLSAARLRYFGGTSNHWGGNVRPLDPIDFEYRPWIPYSGWPFGINELLPYYERARQFCGLPKEAFDIRHWSQAVGAYTWNFADHAIQSKVFHTLGGPNLLFGVRYRELFHRSANITTLLNANVVGINTDTSASNVSGLRVKTLSGKVLTLKSRFYALAAGGIENPRILLNADQTNPYGLGNDNDLVGRFFMEHLTVPTFGEFHPSDAEIDPGFYKGDAHDWGSAWGILTLAPEQIRKYKLANLRYQLSKVTNAFNVNMEQEGMQSLKQVGRDIGARKIPNDFGRHIANIIADIDYVGSAGYQRIFHGPDYPLVKIDIVVIAEQVPNPDSRVTLNNQRDALGLKQAVLDWRVSELDSINVARSAEILANSFGFSGLGRLIERIGSDVFDSINPHPHIHHMGTTRMHVNPKNGVVDPNCLVHGMTNLFVAGSSVFPTVGNVNPTYTIIALGIRLADHIKKVLQ